MVYPIYVYGSPVLRKSAQPIDENMNGLVKLVEDMFETMYKSDGVGLAAPQIGISKQVFVIDAEPMAEDAPELKGFKKAFVNPVMINQSGDDWSFNEGCLSIPNIREDIMRPSNIEIEYYDEHFQHHRDKFDGIKARIIQHEYDHLHGILFVDKINPLRKRILKGKLNAISKGKVDISYKIKYPG